MLQYSSLINTDNCHFFSELEMENLLKTIGRLFKSLFKRLTL